MLTCMLCASLAYSNAAAIERIQVTAGAELTVWFAGSMNMSYDSSNLTTPDIKWLGVRPSDLDRFNIPEQCRLPMTDEDIKTGKKLVSSP